MIIYEKDAAKHISKFVPEDEPLPDEVEAIKRADESIEKYGTIPHDAINWD